MAWALILISWVFIFESHQSLSKIKSLSNPIHQTCIEFFEKSHQRAVYQALACGKTLQSTDPEEKALKVSSIAVGIYHVLVVSGAHLTFLEKILIRTQTPKLLIKLILFFFCLMTHWDPPVVRALFESLVRKSSQSSWLSIFLSYALSLSAHPQWIHSYSLHLSLAARAAFEVPAKGMITQALLASIFLWPLIHAWSPIQISILVLGVLTAEISLAVWCLSLITFCLEQFLILLLSFLKFESLNLHQLVALVTQWPHQLVHLWHFLLEQLSRWQSHELEVFFRIRQKHLFLYASLLLIVTGCLRRVHGSTQSQGSR